MDSILKQIEDLEYRALEVEGDSDNPLRVAAANELYEQADRLRQFLGTEDER